MPNPDHFPRLNNRETEPVPNEGTGANGTSWRVAQFLSTMGFVGLFALIAVNPAGTALWAWLVVSAAWLVPGGWMIWTSWRSRKSS